MAKVSGDDGAQRRDAPADGRTETEPQRLDRNWDDLLQELRVVQTGVQLLTGFLLTLPFQQRFASLTPRQEDLYLAVVAAAITATGFLIAPVALHRVLFRRHAMRTLVRVAHRLALVGILLLGLAILGVAVLITDVVKGGNAAWVAAALALAMLGSLWVALPLTERARLARLPADPAGGQR